MERMTYGAWLKQQRLARGWTQTELESLAGLSEKYASAAERGRVALPDEETRARIHAVLDTTEDDLVAAGILERLESPVPGGGPVYINPGSVRRIQHTIAPPGAFERSLVPDEVMDLFGQRVLGSRLTNEQLTALATILVAFRRQNGIAE